MRNDFENMILKFSELKRNGWVEETKKKKPEYFKVKQKKVKMTAKSVG